MADQKELKKRLKALMNRPENQICSDCPERQPRWASLIVPPPGAPDGSPPIGAFCCLECSGSHRRLGVHISFVRSINLDSWKEKEVLAMENGGNAKVNAIFEANLARSGVQKPSNHASGPTRERFIRDKYERRKFYDPSAFDDLPESSAPTQQQQQRAPTVGTPSDAARQRVEERRARTKKASSTVSEDSATARSRRPMNRGDRSMSEVPSRSARRTVDKAPISAPAPPMDLLDLSSDPTPPPASNNSSQLDLFDFLVADRTNGESADGPKTSDTTAPTPSSASQDIMALYNNSANQQPMMQQGFATGMVVMQQPNSNPSNMANMTSMMGQMNLQQQPQQGLQQQPQQGFQQQPQQGFQQQPQQGFQQQPQMMMYQQQQQQQMMMMQQQQMMMMQQQRGMDGNMTTMMMQQQPVMAGKGNAMMMVNNGFGAAPMGGGPPVSQFQQQTPQSASPSKQMPEKEDPFAQFGVNVFRS